jgi:hypothetical protein
MQAHPTFYFSLDPEYACPKNLHLYDLWVRLQERQGSKNVEPAGEDRGRKDILARSRDELRGLKDPWYDGCAYGATILVSPNKGLDEKLLSNTSDPARDVTMQLAERWASNSFYAPGTKAMVQLCHAESAADAYGPVELELAGFRSQASGYVHRWSREVPHSFLLGCLTLDKDLVKQAHFEHSGVQIGKDLWRLLSPQADGVPPDFEQRHLIQEHNWVAVWNRRGIAMACREQQMDPVDRLKGCLTDLTRVVKFINDPPPEESASRDKIEEWLAGIRKAQKSLIQIEAANCNQHSRVLRKLLEAVNLAAISERIADLAESYRDEEEANTGRLIGDVLAFASILGLILGYFQIEGIGLLKDKLGQGGVYAFGYAFGIIGGILLWLLYRKARSGGFRKGRKESSETKNPKAEGNNKV